MLYTLGHACSDVVSWGSEKHENQMARQTDLQSDVQEPQWTWVQFSSGKTRKINNMAR